MSEECELSVGIDAGLAQVGTHECGALIAGTRPRNGGLSVGAMCAVPKTSPCRDEPLTPEGADRQRPICIAQTRKGGFAGNDAPIGVLALGDGACRTSVNAHHGFTRWLLRLRGSRHGRWRK